MPSFCVACLCPGFPVCQRCLTKLVVYYPQKTPNYSVYRYGELPSLLLKKAKYRPNLSVLRYLLESVPVRLWWETADFLRSFPRLNLTYIPMNKSDLRERGYNQAELIANFLGSLFKIPVRTCLQKIKHTPKQSMLTSTRDRVRNVTNAFSIIEASEIKGQSIVLVDDVITTGATTRAALAEIKRAGVGRVGVWSLFRAR